MKEHFNDNYLETKQYPKSFFSGTIQGFDKEKLINGQTYIAVLKGKLTIHGIARNITTKITMKKNGNSIVASTKFPILLEDYSIQVPRMMKNQIAEKVVVLVNAKLIKN